LGAVLQSGNPFFDMTVFVRGTGKIHHLVQACLAPKS